MVRTHFSRQPRGFTLIEVMITVAIVAIIAAVAIPQYTDYITRGRIPDATSALASKAVQAEQFFQDYRTYATAGTSAAPITNPACVSDTTTSKYFDFSCTSATATAFVIKATGKSSMTGFGYTIDQGGTRATPNVPSTGGWTNSTSCWITKKGGVC